MVEQIQMFPLSIPPLGLFKGIICNVERLKEGSLEPWITGRPKLEGETWFEKLKGDPQIPLHTTGILFLCEEDFGRFSYLH